MRLIREDDVMEMLTNIELSCTQIYITEAKTRLSDIPTAYNFEKVLEKLEELTRKAEKDTNYHFDNASRYPCKYPYKYNLADLQERRYEVLCEVLKIVKEGGING